MTKVTGESLEILALQDTQADMVHLVLKDRKANHILVPKAPRGTEGTQVHKGAQGVKVYQDAMETLGLLVTAGCQVVVLVAAQVIKVTLVYPAQKDDLVQGDLQVQVSLVPQVEEVQMGIQESQVYQVYQDLQAKGVMFAIRYVKIQQQLAPQALLVHQGSLGHQGVLVRRGPLAPQGCQDPKARGGKM